MKKTTITVIVILILLVGIFIVKQSFEKDDVIKIGVFSKAVGDAPYFIAKNKGWFDEVGEKYSCDVEYEIFETLPPINEAFATDKLDFIGEAGPPAIVGRAAGIDIRIKGIQTTYTQQIVVPTDSNIQTIADLKDKKIAVLSGTSSHYALPKLLKQNGVKESEVEMFDMIPPDARAAFETGQIDAWAVWPPWIEQQIISGEGRTLSDANTFIQVIFAVRGEFADKNPELTTEIYEVIERAKRWSIENEAEAQQIVSEEVTLPLEVIEEAWKTMNLDATIGDVEINDMQAKADFLYDKGVVKNKVDVSVDLIDIS